MEIVNYKYTWCDYLTKCKHFPNIEVGSFYCNTCKYCESITLDPKDNEHLRIKPSDKTYYKKRYFTEYEGVCKCNK
jgi:hypothetical protein